MDAMAYDDEEDAIVPIITEVKSLMAVSARAHSFLTDITQLEMDFATSLT